MQQNAEHQGYVIINKHWVHWVSINELIMMREQILVLTNWDCIKRNQGKCKYKGMRCMGQKLIHCNYY